MTATTKKSTQNPMRKINIVKITLNVGAGKNEDLLKKSLILMGKITPVVPVKTITTKRIPAWGLRPGLAIGCKVTIRKGTLELFKRLVAAKGNTLKMSNFDEKGNLAFGIPEYIDIPGLEYDPDLKIIGLEVAVTLERPGYRIKHRRLRPMPVGRHHQVTKHDAVAFIKELGVEVA